jgi:hypothetical protein
MHFMQCATYVDIFDRSVPGNFEIVNGGPVKLWEVTGCTAGTKPNIWKDLFKNF